MLTIRKVPAIISSILVTLIVISTVFASSIIKEYTFTQNGNGKLKYKAEKYIEENDKTYKLNEDKDIKYSLISKVKDEITKTYTVDDMSKVENEITENGKTYKLVDTQSSSLESQSGYTKEIEYSSAGEVKNAITEKGKVLKLVGTQKLSKEEVVNRPATFRGSKNSKMYTFNGKTVTLLGSEPTWSGYKTDLENYLKGITGNTYNIQSIVWTSETKQGNNVTRIATVTATRNVPYVKATYTESENNTFIVTAKYENADENSIKQVATATVTYDEVNTGLYTTAKIILATAGVLILILAVALIIWLLSKRKKKDDGR